MQIMLDTGQILDDNNFDVLIIHCKYDPHKGIRIGSNLDGRKSLRV